MIQRRKPLRRTKIVRVYAKSPDNGPARSATTTLFGAKQRWPDAAKKVEELLQSGMVEKASTFKPKQRPIRKRRKLRDGEKSQLQVFWDIWADRPHVSQVSGQPLVDPPDDTRDEEGMRAWLSQFSHLLPKGTYKGLRCDERNIILKTAHEHHQWEMAKTYEQKVALTHQEPGWKPILLTYCTLFSETHHGGVPQGHP